MPDLSSRNIIRSEAKLPLNERSEVGLNSKPVNKPPIRVLNIVISRAE